MEWIPVTKQIPEDFERVLIWWVTRETNEGNYGFGYQVDDVWYGDGAGMSRVVLAWMPLPARYEGGTNA